MSSILAWCIMMVVIIICLIAGLIDMTVVDYIRHKRNRES